MTRPASTRTGHQSPRRTGVHDPDADPAGADDRCTPLGQAQELLTAIAETGTEVELVVYPREGHVPVEQRTRWTRSREPKPGSTPTSRRSDSVPERLDELRVEGGASDISVGT
jgi:hypothetical protein